MLCDIKRQGVYIAISGNGSEGICKYISDIKAVKDIHALSKGVLFTSPNVESLIDIGSQGARYITDFDSVMPSYSINEHCAGGTGSFFESQMARLGLKIEDYSTIVDTAKSTPRLSGKCAVFAKTDIIHRQQEGTSTADILQGLCFAMIRNFRATIVKNTSIKKPVVFSGGVTKNSGVVKALKEVFALNDDELIISENAEYIGAIGTALFVDDKSITLDELLKALSGITHFTYNSNLVKLKLSDNIALVNPPCSEVITSQGVALGIDIGSTSTDLILTAKDGSIVDYQYLRTGGSPEKTVREGLANIRAKYGDIEFISVGVTGSGRDRIGRMMGADSIYDEITTQAKAAAFINPDVDSVFEIGGQDSKYISLSNGKVVDFQMNKICAAGTGSFIEEQATRMGVTLAEFGKLALESNNPSELGERCTVFIETAITEAEGSGAKPCDIAAGLCYSVVNNYLHKVVGTKAVGENIVLQGGVAYNSGIVAAFKSVYGDKLTVSPVFAISGAYGVSLLALENATEKSKFLGFDFPSIVNEQTTLNKQIKENQEFYKKAGQLASIGYDPTIDPNKKTIGVPLVLIMFKFFPMVNNFFKTLGFNVILSGSSTERTIDLSQQYAHGETCYPIKLIYGHMLELAEKKVDYIFLPCIHTIKHPHAHALHNYACPYMQTAAKSIFDELKLADKGIKLLNPVFDLELGAKNMAMSMVGTGQKLGFPKPLCMLGLVKGAIAVNKYSEDVEKLGREMLASVKPHDKILVLITRNYGISDPVLNMGIPKLLLERGYKVMTLGHLPGMSLDISKDYPNMYWPFGDHILSGAKLIKNHPNLYAIYLTNHGCGPDTMVSHMFRDEMGDKPYLHIEVDEHYS